MVKLRVVTLFVFLLAFSLDGASRRQKVTKSCMVHCTIDRIFFDFPNNETWAMLTDGWCTIEYIDRGNGCNTIKLKYYFKEVSDKVFYKVFNNVKFVCDDTYKTTSYYVEDLSDNMIMWLLSDREYDHDKYVIFLEKKEMINK